MESVQPATGEVWKSFESTTELEVLGAVTRARAAAAAWAGTPLGQRVAVLRRFHDLLFERRADLAEVIHRETDKPAGEALSTEISVVLDDARWLQRAVQALHRRERWFAPASLAMARKRLRVVHEPHGVVAVITPWNYPFMLASSRLLSALATGNAVVFKPSELTPSTGEFTRALLVDAGVPADCIGLVQGDGVTGAALCAAPVDKVFFTGSVAAGRSVARACAERLIPCGLELGGSDAAIVLDDADVASAASGIAWGRFSNAGQTCVAPKRVFVEAGAYDAFVATVRDVVSKLRPVGAGDGYDVGAMIRPQFTAELEAQRDDALTRGAQVAATVSGGAARAFAPTVLVDVPEGARVLHEETFGPLMVVSRVRDADDAVARANAGEFGLSASVWSRDAARAARVAQALQCGTVAINDVLVTAGIVELPHGGIRHSGMGRIHGMAGLEDCVRTKGIAAERFPAWRQSWWFGYSRSHRDGIDAFMRFAHDPSLVGRLRALPGFLRFLLRPERAV